MGFGRNFISLRLPQWMHSCIAYKAILQLNPKPESEQSNWATDAEILPHSKITFSQAFSTKENMGTPFRQRIFSHKIASYGFHQWITSVWQCSRIYLRKNKINNSRLRFNWHTFFFPCACSLCLQLLRSFCIYFHTKFHVCVNSLFIYEHSTMCQCSCVYLQGYFSVVPVKFRSFRSINLLESLFIN